MSKQVEDREDKYDSKENSPSEDSRSRSNSRNPRKDKNNSRSPSDRQDHDSLSIYIGNVDYSATEDELRDTFLDCGDIVRVTIIKNMKTGHPKGAAFIEFTDKEGVNTAINMNGKECKGRPLIVTMKKPRPERAERTRDRDRDYYDRNYDRRGPPRSGGMYSNYPVGRGSYYNGPVPRGAYYSDPRYMYSDPRRQSHMPQTDSHMQQRYDPYKRPDFYDPYMMMSRGMQAPYHQNDPRKVSDSRGDSRYKDARDNRSDPRDRTFMKDEPTLNGRPVDSMRSDSMRNEPRSLQNRNEQPYSNRR